MPPKKRTKKDDDDDTPAAPAVAGPLAGTVILAAGDLSRVLSLTCSACSRRQSAAEIKKFITDNGGETLTRFTAKVTHLVTVAGNAKIDDAVAKGVAVVSEDWLTESVAKKAKQDEKAFALATAAKRDADDESDKGKARGKRAKKDTKDDTTPAAAAPVPAAATPAAAPPSPKSEEKKVKVIKKGKAPVDVTSGLVSSHYVYADSDGTIWDAMLNQTNISQNNNKFYVVQILAPDSGAGGYVCFQRWGRVGEPGQNLKRSFPTVDGAKGEFLKKFKDKSGNDWSHRALFVPKANKYTLIEIDYGNDDPTPTAAAAPASTSPKKEQPGSALDKRVQDVVSMIFDIKMMERTLVELEFDVKKMPLGKLTKKQVKEGYEVLKQIEQTLENKGSGGDLSVLSSRFYTLIPHNFGRAVPPPIRTVETLKQKMQLLEAMADVEIAQSIIKESEKDDSHNLIDSNYSKLKCKIEPVEKNSAEYKQIHEFVMNNQENGRQKLELMELFKVDREGERPRFETKKHIGNRKLMWHGSRLTNFAGILSQGLRIAPPEAPASGYRFGKGLYFADIMTLSSMYCRVTEQSPYGFMLLCDTALGKTFEAPRDQFMTNAPAGYDSTWALGTIEPDPKGDVKHADGFVIPSGKIQNSGRTGVSCREHQFITYTEAQSEMKYLLKLKWVKF